VLFGFRERRSALGLCHSAGADSSRSCRGRVEIVSRSQSLAPSPSNDPAETERDRGRGTAGRGHMRGSAWGGRTGLGGRGGSKGRAWRFTSSAASRMARRCLCRRPCRRRNGGGGGGGEGQGQGGNEWRGEGLRCLCTSRYNTSGCFVYPSCRTSCNAGLIIRCRVAFSWIPQSATLQWSRSSLHSLTLTVNVICISSQCAYLPACKSFWNSVPNPVASAILSFKARTLLVLSHLISNELSNSYSSGRVFEPWPCASVLSPGELCRGCPCVLLDEWYLDFSSSEYSCSLTLTEMMFGSEGHHPSLGMRKNAIREVCEL
jgi:hypothetical protein